MTGPAITPTNVRHTPAGKDADLRSAVLTLWLRFISLGIAAVVFAEALLLARGRVQNWTFYLSTSGVFFEIAVRLITAALLGMLLGSIFLLLMLPFLWRLRSSRPFLAAAGTTFAVALVVLIDSRIGLTNLINWSYNWSNHRGIIDSALIGAFYLAFAAALLFARTRQGIISSLDPLLATNIALCLALATFVITAAFIVGEFALRKTTPFRAPIEARQQSTPNILLITFDALSAEDMSLYGYGLPTTPNIDSFARGATVFTNFYSASTFTTPSVATIITGRYPSETHVHQLQGTERGDNTGKSLPNVMRTAGYATGSFISNPYPFYYAKTMQNAFDILPEPVFRQGGMHSLWAMTKPLHQDSGIGIRVDEYTDLEGVWDSWRQLPSNQSLRFRPTASFEQARMVLDQLPGRFFLWVHTMAPHDPYLPDPADRGRFLPDSELQIFEKEGRRFQPLYEPKEQSLVDRRRLGYDEYVASADRAFGSFISELEKSGKLRNTVVIVSADHGESFQGGVYRHESPYQTRPVIHVPLIIRMPDQQGSRRVSLFVDQTAIAPTILELAGQRKPAWMHGQSLVECLSRNSQGEAQGLAFTEFLEKNSTSKPLRHGTVGVIDGRSQYQYVLDLDTRKGSLRPLNEAQVWNVDSSNENPALAQQLRQEIYSRFPELVQK